MNHLHISYHNEAPTEEVSAAFANLVRTSSRRGAGHRDGPLKRLSAYRLVKALGSTTEAKEFANKNSKGSSLCGNYTSIGEFSRACHQANKEIESCLCQLGYGHRVD